MQGKIISALFFILLLSFTNGKLKEQRKQKQNKETNQQGETTPLLGSNNGTIQGWMEEFDNKTCYDIKDMDICLNSSGCCWRNISFENEIPKEFINKTDEFKGCNLYNAVQFEKFVIETFFSDNKPNVSVSCCSAGKLVLGFCLVFLLLFL